MGKRRLKLRLRIPQKEKKYRAVAGICNWRFLSIL